MIVSFHQIFELRSILRTVVEGFELQLPTHETKHAQIFRNYVNVIYKETLKITARSEHSDRLQMVESRLGGESSTFPPQFRMSAQESFKGVFSDKHQDFAGFSYESSTKINNYGFFAPNFWEKSWDFISRINFSWKAQKTRFQSSKINVSDRKQSQSWGSHLKIIDFRERSHQWYNSPSKANGFLSRKIIVKIVGFTLNSQNR